MSPKSAPDLSYDLPPADERKGKTKAESDRHLGNLIVTHRSTLIRYPAGTMAPPRQKNVVGMNYWRRVGPDSRGAAHAVAGIDRHHDRPRSEPASAAFLESCRAMLSTLAAPDGGLPYRVSACDHLVAILELDQATVHFSACKHTARLAFAPLSVPSVDVSKGHRH
jgi:hypothetical protein